MRTVLTLTLGSALLLAGCGADAKTAVQDQQSPSNSSSEESPSVATPGTTRTAAPTPADRPSGGTILKASSSEFGTIWFDGTGQAIYLFEKEATSRPECYQACAAAWPPVLTIGSPRATGKVDPGLVDTVRRADGSTQVTYAGHPLYYYVHDGKNEVLCHNVVEFGGLWLVVTPGGEAAA